MGQLELLRYVVEVLERLRLAYFITGSTATIFFGEPRYTNDIDVVVDLPADRIQEFLAQFPSAEFYFSEEAAAQAVRSRTQFNIIHPESGWKVDVIVPSDTAFNQSRFARRRRVKPGDDYEASFSSAEDVLIKKMQYFQDGGSEKHLRDIAAVLKVSGGQVDLAYIAQWVRALQLEEVWSAVLNRVGS